MLDWEDNKPSAPQPQPQLQPAVPASMAATNVTHPDPFAVQAAAAKAAADAGATGLAACGAAGGATLGPWLWPLP